MASNATQPIVDPFLWTGIDMGPIFNSFYVGTVLSFILSGITILQAWTYFPSRDRAFIQLVAALMIVLDLVSTGLTAQGLWFYVVPHFGSLIPLGTLVETLSAECTISVVIIFISQAYFAWQLWTVLPASTKYIVPTVVMIFSVVSFVGGMICSAYMVTDKHNILMNRSFRFAVAAGIAKGASSVADTIATVSFCWALGRSKTGIKQTDSMIKTLIQYIVQRGIVVTAIQTLFLLMFFLTDAHTYWLALHVNVTRLYANTFFAMLNGRDNLRSKKSEVSYALSSTAASDTFQARSGNSYGNSKGGHSGGVTSEVYFDNSNLNGDVRIDKSVMISDV